MQYAHAPRYNWRMLQDLSKIPKSECPDVWIRLPRHKMAEIMVQYGRTAVPLERILFGHLLAGLLWERQFEEVYSNLNERKVPNWECLFVHRKQNLF